MKTRIVLPSNDRTTVSISKETLDKVRTTKPSGVSLQTHISVLIEQALEQRQAS